MKIQRMTQNQSGIRKQTKIKTLNSNQKQIPRKKQREQSQQQETKIRIRPGILKKTKLKNRMNKIKIQILNRLNRRN